MNLIESIPEGESFSLESANSSMQVQSKWPAMESILFDIYSGAQVAPGKKSLAYRITFQSPAHTLTDDEVDKVQGQILDRLYREMGATLRSWTCR